MDLRLTDNLMNFLHFDNLQNRYDHVILAGASLLCSNKHKELFVKEKYEDYKHWKKVFDDHVKIAMKLHHIHDVYIIEHQDCGAYSSFLDSRHKKADLSTLKLEEKCHKLFSDDLADELVKNYKLNVHTFFIDLRGNIKLLNTIQAGK
jgi:hypothetical protein